MKEQSMTYADVGVDNDVMNVFKRMAQQAAQETGDLTTRFGIRLLEWTRGESVQIYDTPWEAYLAHVEEGLGTKNLVADAMYDLTGRSFYDHIAQDTVAMIVNDMITSGALPFSIQMHLAVGNSNWFDNQTRNRDLAEGWAKACQLAGCTWSGGETPTLKGIIMPGAVELSGSAVGIINPKERLIMPSIAHGDVIILVESSGIHANGLTMARAIAERKDGFWRRIAHLFFPRKFPRRALPNGYLTTLSDGRTYGESLLTPTHIYIRLVEACLNRGVNIHYAVNITGHGWRKLMRDIKHFTYVIERLPNQQPIFNFIQEHGSVTTKEMYANLNMGAGFAIYVPESDAAMVLETAASSGLRAIKAGYVEKSAEKKVFIAPLNIKFKGTELGVR